MNVLVDTSVWSLALRRAKRLGDAVPRDLAELVDEGRVAIIGPIRQELLSGIKERVQFDRLRQHLLAFPDLVLESSDYEQAADFCNKCRTRGIQGSNTDFLICAVAARRDMSIFTTDGDFRHFSKALPVTLYEARR